MLKQVINLPILFLCLILIAKTNATAQIYQDPVAIQFFADALGKGKANINMVLYYSDEEFDHVQSQKIVIYQQDLSGQIDILNLNLDSVTQFATGPNSCGYATSKYKALYYSDTIDLGLSIVNYVATWGYCGYNQISNIDYSNRLDFALILELNNMAESLPNSAPRFKEILLPQICKGNSLQTLNLIDANNDSVVLSLDTFYSNKTFYEEVYPYPVSSIPNSKSVMDDLGYNGTILVSPPPYRAYAYKMGYSVTEPIGLNGLKIDNQKKEIEYNSNNEGRNIIAFNISDFENNKIKSTHKLILIQQTITP